VSAAAVFAAYVHDFDPVALDLWGPLALRWYGLAYLAGFVVGMLLLKNLGKRGLWVLPPAKAADFVAAAALIGVFVGGRLGYILFYHIPREGLASIAADPMLVLRVWDGGMSSHGGILGLVLFTWFYSRRAKVSWTGLGDGLCVVAPVGIFFGRMANFINGELYGRVADGVAWSMKFPLALMDRKAPEYDRFHDAAAAAVDADQGLLTAYQALDSARFTGDAFEYTHARSGFFDVLLEANRQSDAVSAAIAPYLESRHPSQIYAALLEGVLLFVTLWVVRLKFRKAPDGLLTGLFFGLYAVVRIIGEQFREPDAGWVVEGVVTKGQFLSAFMFIFAAGFLAHAWRQGRKADV
jgi:phosphatidylglycerol---prolipoprotein diacylglyceryl transferase